jgi:hypothetical protein
MGFGLPRAGYLSQGMKAGKLSAIHKLPSPWSAVLALQLGSGLPLPLRLFSLAFGRLLSLAFGPWLTISFGRWFGLPFGYLLGLWLIAVALSIVFSGR